ncbi:immunoglobulin-like domain-containing protein [Listeria newyorkensis]|uniref:Bacterial Ig domain-containing protein n=1 Tax=Listeria newyorkensis TaxID=1497681 RepID=A0A841YYU5_9LIST|nr:immunoglobulin-like domain-containing protein [Listeria newyorkensis]MBC1457716.1 hypothetical protein [Listeria newyorkensis]
MKMKKQLASVLVVAVPLLIGNSYDVNAAIQDNSNELGASYVSEKNTDALFVNLFSFGKDSTITGYVSSGITDIGIEINGKDIGGLGIAPGSQTFTLPDFLVSQITSLEDNVTLVGRAAPSGEVIARQQVVMIDGTNENTGTLSPTPFLIDRMSTLTGSFTGDISTVALRINGDIHEQVDVRGNGTFSYPTVISNLEDRVEVLGYNGNGDLVTSARVLLEERESYDRIVSANAERLHEQAIWVTGTFSTIAEFNKSIKMMVPEINGIRDYSQLVFVDSPNQNGAFDIRITGVSQGDSIKLIGLTANSVTADVFELTGI